MDVPCAKNNPKKKRIHQYAHGYPKSPTKTRKFEKAIQLYQTYRNVTKAAKEAGVDRFALKRRLTGKVDLERRSGPEPIFNAEEEKLMASWLIDTYQKGFGLKPGEFLSKVASYIAKDKRKQKLFKNNKPSHSWYYNFMSRNCSQLTIGTEIPLENCMETGVPKDIDSREMSKQLVEENMNLTSLEDVACTVDDLKNEVNNPKVIQKEVLKVKAKALVSHATSNESRRKFQQKDQKAKLKYKKVSKNKPILISENDTKCNICQIQWLDDIEGADWVQCSLCDEWQHVHCIPQWVNKDFITNNEMDFYCHKCCN